VLNQWSPKWGTRDVPWGCRDKFKIGVRDIYFYWYRGALLKSLETAVPSPSGHDMAQAVSRRPLCGGPDSRPVQSVWDWWWTKWHWGRFSQSSLVFPCQYYSIVALYTYIIWGMTNRPACGRSSETVSPDRHEQTGVLFNGKRQKAALKVLSQRDRTRNGVPGRSFSCRYN
jgi:hypothetical protein